MNETEERIATLLLASIETGAAGAEDVKLYSAIIAYGQFLVAVRTRAEVEAQEIDNKINSKGIQS